MLVCCIENGIDLTSLPDSGLVIHCSGRQQEVGDASNMHPQLNVESHCHASRCARSWADECASSCTKLTFHLIEASSSIAVEGSRKLVTSAMCTPNSMLPFGNSRTCKASSMSLQPGGSTLHIAKCRKSSLQNPSTCCQVLSYTAMLLSDCLHTMQGIVNDGGCTLHIATCGKPFLHRETDGSKDGATAY